MRKIKYIGSLIVIVTMLFTSLTISAGEASLSKGGVLVIHSQEEPPLLNPLFNDTEIAHNVYNLIFSGLIGVDDNFEYYPEMIVSIPTVGNKGVYTNAEGQMVVTYKLRERLFWHDGFPVTSADVRFTWECYINPNIDKGRNPHIKEYQKISKIETPDDRTIKVYFEENYPDYRKLFRYILPKHGFIPRKVYPLDQAHPFNYKPIGSGPFMVVDWQMGKKLILDVNPYYYRQKPNLDQVIYLYKKLNRQVTSDFENGRIHILQSSTMEEIRDKLRSTSEIESFEVTLPYFEEIVFNTQSNKLKDVNIRRALAHTINRDKIAQDYSTLKSTWSDAHPNSLLFDMSLKEIYDYDLTMAQYYLDQTDWLVDPADGIRKNPQGEKLSFNFLTDETNLHNQVTAYLKEIWSYIGIETTVNLIETEKLDDGIIADNYDVILHKRKMAVDGADRFNFYSSTQMPPRGMNYSHFDNPQLEAIFSDISRVNTIRDQKIVNQVLKSELPSLPLFSYVRNLPISKKLRNFRPNLVYGNTWNSPEWWLN